MSAQRWPRELPRLERRVNNGQIEICAAP